MLVTTLKFSVQCVQCNRLSDAPQELFGACLEQELDVHGHPLPLPVSFDECPHCSPGELPEEEIHSEKLVNCPTCHGRYISLGVLPCTDCDEGFVTVDQAFVIRERRDCRVKLERILQDPTASESLKHSASERLAELEREEGVEEVIESPEEAAYEYEEYKRRVSGLGWHEFDDEDLFDHFGDLYRS